jgi:hypothetical protein
MFSLLTLLPGTRSIPPFPALTASPPLHPPPNHSLRQSHPEPLLLSLHKQSYRIHNLNGSLRFQVSDPSVWECGAWEEGVAFCEGRGEGVLVHLVEGRLVSRCRVQGVRGGVGVLRGGEVVARGGGRVQVWDGKCEKVGDRVVDPALKMGFAGKRLVFWNASTLQLH